MTTLSNITGNPITLDTFIASDHHFGHSKIEQYEPSRGRYRELGFTSMEEMLIHNHNSKVSPEDTVLFLGDFSWNDPKNWISKLNGKKYLVLGNHDRKSDVSYEGFEGVFRGLYVDINGLLFNYSSQDPLLSALIMPLNGTMVCFSHYSVGYEDVYDHQNGTQIQIRKHITLDLFNTVSSECGGTVIHGHLHSHLAEHSENIEYVNVCLEHTNFAPIRLRDLLSIKDF